MRKVRIPPLSFLPAGVTLGANLFVATLVRLNRGDLSPRFAVFLTIMLMASLAVAVPKLWARIPAIVVLAAGVAIGVPTVGWYYVPSVIAAARVTIFRGRN